MTPIILNGESLHVAGTHLSYEDVLRLAGQPADAQLTVVYSVRLAPDLQRSGSITRGKSVELAPGLRVSAVFTGAA